MKTPDISQLKTRIIETADMDRKHILRPLLLFKGGLSEGRVRTLVNLVVGLMDAEIDTVSQAVKLYQTEDLRHICGAHANPQHMTFAGILSRLHLRKDVTEQIPGLWEYVRHLGRRGDGNGFNGYLHALEEIPEYVLRVRSDRTWRLTPKHLRERSPRVQREVLPEFYPYISGKPTEEHDMILAVDAIVPRGLPNSMRCDLCQDMIVAVLSGEVTVENLKGDLKKYMSSFWKMFPDKYGHVSLDSIVPGTDDLKRIDRLDNKRRML